MSSRLVIKDLKVSIEEKQILQGIDLVVNAGEVHAVMGPNGSGKSTLASTIAGHPDYQIDGGSVSLDGTEVLEMSPDERANIGLFLAFQYPVEIPGVRVSNFLKLAYQARFKDQPERLFAKAIDFRKHLKSVADKLKVKTELLDRGLNEGFSGGEKKQLEIVQMALLEPKFAILDETDSGLDIDAIKKVAMGVQKIVKENNTGVIVITHYQRILDYLKPDFVHVVKNGKVVKNGGADLVKELEETGYENIAK